MQQSKEKQSPLHNLKDFLNQHQDIRTYLEILGCPRNQNISKFKVKRFCILNRMVDELSNFLADVKREYDKVDNEYLSKSGIQSQDVNLLCYDDNSKNMDVRKIAFLKLYMKNIELKILFQKRTDILKVMKDANDLLDFICSHQVNLPSDKFLRISDNFFKIRYDERIEKMNLRLTMLNNYIERMILKVSSYKKPLWVTNYENFLINLIEESYYHLDTDISYFLPSNGEVSLSRCLFNHLSETKNKIDKKINEYFINLKKDEETYSETQQFLNSLTEISYKLLENKKVNINPQKQSIGLLILFRTIFNRCYELYPSHFYQEINPKMINIDEIRKIPYRFFSISTDLIPNIPPETSTVDLFQNDQFYSSAIYFLNNSIFSPNTIDSLYCIHKTINCIHKSAIIYKIKDNVATQNDVNQILCFDDLFSLLIGIFLSSDVVDIYWLSWFLQYYTPKNTISQPLDYDRSNIEALRNYFDTLDLKELKSKAHC